MKKITLFILLLQSIVCYAQKLHPNKVPPAVKSAFMQQFAAAVKPKWEAAKDDYKVNFSNNKMKLNALYDRNGQWLKTEEEIRKNQLPDEVSQTIADEFPGAEIRLATKVTFPENKYIYELVVVQNEKRQYEVQLSPQGKIIQQEDAIGSTTEERK